MKELTILPHLQGVIQQLLAPVVMISASGLLCLAMYNHLSTIVARLRSFHHEQIETFDRLQKGGNRDKQSVLEDRIMGLKVQACNLLKRASLVRNSLFCLLLSILLMLICSLTIGLSLIINMLEIVSLSVFILGIFCMLVAIVYAMIELTIRLGQVKYEDEHVSNIIWNSSKKGTL